MKRNTGNIEATITALRRMTVTQLRQKHLEVFGESTNATNKDFLFKRVAWRIQSLAEGGLSERARRRAEELARDSDIRLTAPRTTNVPIGPTRDAVMSPVLKGSAHDRLPMPGTVLTRNYRGQRIEVKVLTNGFEYEGQAHRSLSAVAKAVTGSHWNGLLFFGLTSAKGVKP